jgi:antitoxin Phd
MKIWPMQDAKARFSELLDTCLQEGPQIITKRGAEAAVLVPVRDRKRLQRTARLTLKELLLAPSPRGKFHVPERGRLKLRAPFDGKRGKVAARAGVSGFGQPRVNARPFRVTAYGE